MSDKYYTKHTNEQEDKYAAVQQAHLTSRHILRCVFAPKPTATFKLMPKMIVCALVLKLTID